ncbi:MAG: NAD(P)H-dependent oxidoreductase subunit E [Acidobacteria bacterium]|nr:NAD(P)H-dependent oxidoreductase subunit E [Acidobacteriota bacterium]
MSAPGGPSPRRPAFAPLAEETRAAMRRLMARYPNPRSALMSMLYLVQAEHGCVSEAGIEEVAGMLDLTKAEVASVATFYTMLKREPLGRYLVSVCTQPPCALAGAGSLRRALEEELGVGFGQTTPDGAITLEEVECVCVCDGAPAVQVNYESYEHLTPEAAVELVRKLRSGGAVPPPVHGSVPVPREAIHRELAGLGGHDPDRGGGES